MDGTDSGRLMQFSLQEFAAEIARGVVDLGGAMYDIRALSGAEMRAVQAARPRPTPPRKRPPGVGQDHPLEPDPTDGKYRQEMDAWHFFVQTVVAAVGLGHRVDGRAWPAEAAEQKKWAETAYAELAGRLSDQELGALFSAVDALGLARLVGKAAGGSSGPRPNQPPTTETGKSPPAMGSPSPG